MSDEQLADSSGMELSVFIAETLRSIVDGVEQAKRTLNPYAKAGNPVINPIVSRAHHSNTASVKFDITVAVSQTDTKGGSGGVKLRVPLMEVGVDGGGSLEVSNSATNTSRVSFSVDVALPSTPISQYPK